MAEPRKARPSKRQEIYTDLRASINNGTLPPGTMLRKIRDEAAERGVHHETVRAAYKQLEADGLVRTTQRRGTVVAEPQQRRRIMGGVSITRDPARGYVFPSATRPGEPWQTHGRPYCRSLPAPAEVTEHFGLPTGAEVLRRRRVTSPEGEPPFQIVDTWISPTGVQDAPAVDEPSPGPGGYLDRLEEAGHGPLAWEETMRARMPDRDESKLLGIARSIPVLESVTVGTSARSGVPIEVTIRVIPSDRVELVAKLRREGKADWPVDPVTPSK